MSKGNGSLQRGGKLKEAVFLIPFLFILTLIITISFLRVAISSG